MDIKQIVEFIQEITEDYQRYGVEKEEREWFAEATKRHIIDISDEEAETIANKLIDGIMMYRRHKEERIKSPQEAIKKLEHSEINEEIELMSKSVADYLDEIKSK